MYFIQRMGQFWARMDQEDGTNRAGLVVVSSGCCFLHITLTDRASTIPSSNIRGCQSGTWSAGHKEIRVTSTKHTNKNDKARERNKSMKW